MKRVAVAFLASIFITTITIVAGHASVQAVGIDVLGGTSWHMPVDAKIGHVVKDPRWETRPWTGAPYYSIRIRWNGLEIEMVHDKMYLAGDRPEIKGFNLSDGFNYFLFNSPKKWGNIEARLGLGPVLGHPEGTVDQVDIGSTGSPSWRIGGLGAQAAVGYRAPIRGGLSGLIEGKVTAGLFNAEYNDDDGADSNSGSRNVNINVPAVGFHLLAGIGYAF